MVGIRIMHLRRLYYLKHFRTRIVFIFFVVLSLNLGLIFRGARSQKSSDNYCLQSDNKLTNVFLPEVELYVRMFSKDVLHYKQMLTRSMRYYWPGNASMVVVLDSESTEDHNLSNLLAQDYPYPRICFQAPVDPKVYHNMGHERMQRDFFYPELFTSKGYLGYVDTDTLFITRVTQDLLFEDGKPVVIGFYGRAADAWWSKVSETTALLFKEKEVMRCMAYFPVILKVDHVVKSRKYLEKLHNSTFDELFQKYSFFFNDSRGRNTFAQFNLMCQYIWMFHRDEYKFYFQLTPYTLDGKWNGERTSPGREGPEYYEKHLKPEQKVPRVRTSVHYPYTEFDWLNDITYKRMLMSGICYSGGFVYCPEKCKFFSESSLHLELFKFEFHDWTWDRRCMDAQKKHYASIWKEPANQLIKAIQLGCKEIDALKVKLSPFDAYPGELRNVIKLFRDKD